MPLSAADFDPFDPKCDPKTQDLGQTSLDIINDVMTGGAFQNPVGTIVNTAKALAGNNISQITNLLDSQPPEGGAGGLQDSTIAALESMNALLAEQHRKSIRYIQ